VRRAWYRDEVRRGGQALAGGRPHQRLARGGCRAPCPEANAALLAGAAGADAAAGALFQPAVPSPEAAAGYLQLVQRPGTRVHMYVSAPPCGDAAVFCTPRADDGLLGPAEAGDEPAAGAVHRTGSKPLACDGKIPQAGEVEAPGLQTVSCIRRKPGAPRHRSGRDGEEN